MREAVETYWHARNAWLIEGNDPDRAHYFACEIVDRHHGEGASGGVILTVFDGEA